MNATFTRGQNDDGLGTWCFEAICVSGRCIAVILAGIS